MSKRSFPDADPVNDAFESLTLDLEDRRPHPSQAALDHLGSAIMSETLDVLLGTALEDFIVPACESLIGGLHLGVQRLERIVDQRRDRLAELLRDFDGSEVSDTELQTLRTQVDAADVAVRALEFVRDAAAANYAAATGEAWSPWRGAVKAGRRTAAQLDAAEALRSLRERRRADSDPGRAVVVFRASPRACAPRDAGRIFDALNWARETWPEMALAITGAPGGDQIARKWALQKRVNLVFARPDFERHGRAAPFRTNDLLLELEPVCVLTLATSLEASADDGRPFGPALNLAQRARSRGVRVVQILARGNGSHVRQRAVD